MYKIEQDSDELISMIDNIYGKGTRDYRGNVIDKGFVKYYFAKTSYRIQEIVNYVSKIGQGKKILDIGISYGFYDIILKEKFGFDITGMEVEDNIDAYCLLPKTYGIEIIPGQLSKKQCQIPDNSYDIIILSEVIEHLRITPMRALIEIKRILKPGGLLLLSTPNIARASNILRLIIGQNIVEPFPEDDSALEHVTDRVSHIREYTMNELRALVMRSGYTIKKTWYSDSYDKMLSRKTYNPMQISYRIVLMLLCKIIPPFRSLVFVVCQKPI